MKYRILTALACAACLTFADRLSATETEHLNMRVLPAPGKVTIDGKCDDWDLTGGIFACGDVENARNVCAVWFHAMYDRDNLYLLGRWLDPTPMNHPGTTKGDYGFNGDCLQVRVVTAPDIAAPEVHTTDRNAKDAATVRTTHLTCWRDRDKIDVIDVCYGRNLNEGGMKDAKTQGGAQAFVEYPDHSGYVQEIAIPWKLLTKPGVEIKPGSRIMMTLEPNFLIGTGGRLTIKDLFKPGAAIDRVFTFQGNGCWGYATLEPQGKLPPRSVRLADGREFSVRIEQGLPVVDWSGLIKNAMPEGFKPIKFTLPQDSYVSLNIFAPDGTVARQLLTSHFLTKGEHVVNWDGLGTPSFRRPGQPLPAGEYAWEGFCHTGINLSLRGWAGNSGPAPWIGWGGDHGNPIACAACGKHVVVGWAGGEGDKPLLACDLQGNIQWKNIRGGIASAGPVAIDEKTAYIFNGIDQYAAKAIYRLDVNTGKYTEWSSVGSTDLTMKNIWGDEKDIPGGPSAICAVGGRVLASFSSKNAIMVIDADSGKIIKKLNVPDPGSIQANANEVFFVSKALEIHAVNIASGAERFIVKPTFPQGQWINALGLDKAGNLYAGIRGPVQHYVDVFGPDGKPIRRIGRTEGRALLGPWTPDGMLNISAIAIDEEGKMWVAEDDGCPKRVSVWDAQTGALKAEYFGAASYGGTGGAISPVDPYVMAGQGCEWKVDPQTGRSSCVGVFTRDGMASTRFGFGPNDRLYVATTPGMLGYGPVRIFERVGAAQYKFRAMLRQVEKDVGGKKVKVTEVWSDGNDDGKEQPGEVQSYDLDLGGWFQGWYLTMTPDLTMWGCRHRVQVTGWTSCGAPLYDLTKAKKMAGPQGSRGGMGAQQGHGSVDGKYMLYNCSYGDDYSTNDCYDIASGRLMWTYPSNFTGVHGSHRACGPTVGMIRGAYDIAGAAKLPPPIGNIWVIPTNKGEWHALTEKGFYLTKFFESDPTKVTWPPQAVPGANLNSCPPGAGEEAFGGSIAQGKDGKLSLQAGHTSLWNVAVTGLDTIRALSGGKVALSGADVRTAGGFRQRYITGAEGLKQTVAHKATPAFTGDLEKDFAGGNMLKYQKDDATACTTTTAWDEKNLYVGFEVKDATPWINGADAPEFMYARGDTVDVQLGTDPAAAKDRKEAVLGDMRISIGPYQGKPTVVIYRRVAAEKHPKIFSSGVTKGYEMQSVVVLKDAKVEVKVDPVAKKYVVEAALPMAALGLSPASGMKLRADVGVTHGNKEGNDTVLRTYWSNQNTGLVSDEVYELEMTPAAWGELRLE